jgi:restriction modification system DNA specificity domain protein
VLRSSNIQGGQLILDQDLQFVDKAIGKQQNLRKGDIVICMANGSKKLVGKTAIYKGQYSGSITVGAFCSIFRSNNTLAEYLLQTHQYKKYLNMLLAGTNINNLKSSDLEKLKFILPSNEEEQQKIAAFLIAVDKRVALLERKVQQLEAYKRGVMQQLFSQQLRFTRPDGSHFPVWQEKRLGEVFDAARGSSLSWGDIETDGKNKAILYGQLYTIYPEVVSQVVSRTNSNKGTPSKNGDLLLPNSTTTTGIDLANATALNEDGVLLGGDITVLRFKETGSNIFYAYYLSHFMKYKLAAYGQGSTIVHMYFSQYKNMKIVEPSVAEQQKIAEFLSALDEKIALTRQQLDKTKQFKKGLLQRMFV